MAYTSSPYSSQSGYGEFARVEDAVPAPQLPDPTTISTTTPYSPVAATEEQDFLSVPYSTAIELDAPSLPYAPAPSGSTYSSLPFEPGASPGLPFAPAAPTSNPSAGPDLYGKTKSWAASKGYGWLLEVDDDDDDDNKPLLEELDINFLDIFHKVKAVLLPYALKPCDPKLTEPDFWGPFFIVLLYSSLILWGQLRVVSWVFTLWLVGSFGVHFLARALGGGEAGYAVTLAVTGYSLIPLVLLAALLPLLGALGNLKVALKVLHALWCTYAARTLLLSEPLRTRHFLLTYPIGLLYGYFVTLHGGV